MPLTADEIRVFNECYGKACELLSDFLFEETASSKPVSFIEKVRARKAIKELKGCLSIHPQHYHSIFILGKVHQRLGEHNEASGFFEQAKTIKNSLSASVNDSRINDNHHPGKHHH